MSGASEIGLEGLVDEACGKGKWQNGALPCRKKDRRDNENYFYPSYSALLDGVHGRVCLLQPAQSVWIKSFNVIHKENCRQDYRN